jgi:hypothetical protein
VEIKPFSREIGRTRYYATFGSNHRLTTGVLSLSFFLFMALVAPGSVAGAEEKVLVFYALI